MNSIYSCLYKKTFAAFSIIFLLLSIGCKQPVPDLETGPKTNLALIKDTGRILSSYRLANSYDQSKLKQRDSIIRSSIKQSLELGYNDGIAWGVINLTAFFFEQGKFDSCEKYFVLGYKHAQHPNFNNNLTTMLFLNHGTFNYLQGNYVKADSIFYEGLKACDNNQECRSDIRFSLLYNLHFTKSLIGQKKLAFKYLNEAEMLARITLDSNNLTMVLALKAQNFIDDKQRDSAQRYLNESIAVNHGVLVLDQRIVYAMVTAESDSPERAIPVIKKGLTEAAATKNDLYRVSLAMELGNVYNKMHEYKNAVKILEPVLKEMLAKGFKDLLKRCYSLLMYSYERQKNYNCAFELQSKLQLMTDSILNIEKINSINEMEVKYKTSEKDRQLSLNKLNISEQEARISKQVNWIISISALVILIMILFMVYSRNKKNQITVLQQQQEISNLKSRMEGEETERQRLSRDLHDSIGGMLSAVLLYASRLESEIPSLNSSKTFSDIKNMIIQTSSDVRETARNLMPDILLKLSFAEAIEHFCYSLNKYSPLDIKIQSHGDLDSLAPHLKIAVYRMLQELMHNVVKHSGASVALVQATLSNGMVCLCVEDNGKGFGISNVNGSGLKNIQHRVENLGGTFSIETNQKTGTSVTIELPV